MKIKLKMMYQKLHIGKGVISMRQKFYVLVSVVVVLLSLVACNKKSGGNVMDNNNQFDRIEFLGHGSLKLFLKNGKVCYIDPYAGDDYKENGDLILITHEHHDHNNISLVPNSDNIQIIRSADCFENGEYKTFDVLDMHIEPVQAYNKNHKITECVGYVITSNGKKIYVAGDTSTTDQMTKLADYNIDYAFLPMDGIYNMDIDEAIECEKIIKAKHTIPYHMAPGELFSEERASKFVTPTTMIVRPGETIEIE